MPYNYPDLVRSLSNNTYLIGHCGYDAQGRKVRITKNKFTNDYFVGHTQELPKNAGKLLADAALLFNGKVLPQYRWLNMSNAVNGNITERSGISPIENSQAIASSIVAVIGLYKEIKELSPSNDFAENIKAYLQVFSRYTKETLQADFDVFNASFDDFLSLNDAEQKKVLAAVNEVLPIDDNTEAIIMAAYKLLNSAVFLVEALLD